MHLYLPCSHRVPTLATLTANSASERILRKKRILDAPSRHIENQFSESAPQVILTVRCRRFYLRAVL